MDQKIKRQRLLPNSWPSRVILNFQPSWSAIIMGTGVISTLLHTSPHKFSGEAIIGTVFYRANILLMVLFTVLSANKYALFPRAIQRMLQPQMITTLFRCDWCDW